MPAGRPTKYKPEFCETIQGVAEQGGWLSQMAEACDVHRSTMDEWASEHPEFSEALTRAKQKAQVALEELGWKGIEADKFNSSQWKHLAAARHAEYRDTSKLHVSGPNDGPIQTEDVSDRELAKAMLLTLQEAKGKKDQE